VVFLAGFLTDHFTRYRPTKAALDQAQQSVSDLTTQLEAANDRIAVLEPDLESATSHVELLGTLVELKTAHFELKNGNLAATKVALSGTAARLENLKPLVETVDATLAGNMLTRLDLIMNGMDNSPASALVDLELLFTNLQSVETLLFGE
jgi:chromosome segregation ATPase